MGVGGVGSSDTDYIFSFSPLGSCEQGGTSGIEMAGNEMASDDPIKQLGLRIDSYLAKGMMKNTKTDQEIQLMRDNECIEVTVQGNNKEMVSIQGLENKFQAQGQIRVAIPSTDILQWKANFPLHETSESFLAQLTSEYKVMFKQGEDKIKQEETKMDEELNAMQGSQTAEVTTINLVNLLQDAVILTSPVSPDSPVRRKMQREIGDALKDKDRTIQKTRILEVLRSILHDGIDNKLRSSNKAKWGGLTNRRGQIGENKTVAAVNQALEGFLGMSVMGMKTHTYLRTFLDKLNIQLTYHNTMDPVTGRVKKTEEVEHDHISTWLKEDEITVTMIESKTREVKPWASAADQAEIAQAAIKHAINALNQLQKDFVTFKEIFPDISKTMMEKIR